MSFSVCTQCHLRRVKHIWIALMNHFVFTCIAFWFVLMVFLIFTQFTTSNITRLFLFKVVFLLLLLCDDCIHDRYWYFNCRWWIKMCKWRMVCKAICWSLHNFDNFIFFMMQGYIWLPSDIFNTYKLKHLCTLKRFATMACFCFFFFFQICYYQISDEQIICWKKLSDESHCFRLYLFEQHG